MNEINKNDIIMFMVDIPSDEHFKQINDTMLDIADEIGKQVVKRRGKGPEMMTTKAYAEIDDRYYRLTFKLRTATLEFVRKQVDQITKKQWERGIKEAQDTSQTSYWL